jgi:hypothetical protein
MKLALILTVSGFGAFMGALLAFSLFQGAPRAEADQPQQLEAPAQPMRRSPPLTPDPATQNWDDYVDPHLFH